MRTTQELHDAARKMKREKIIEALLRAGIVSYDHETDETLQEALVSNIEDGTLDEDDLDGY